MIGFAIGPLLRTDEALRIHSAHSVSGDLRNRDLPSSVGFHQGAAPEGLEGWQSCPYTAGTRHVAVEGG